MTVRSAEYMRFVGPSSGSTIRPVQRGATVEVQVVDGDRRGRRGCGHHGAQTAVGVRCALAVPEVHDPARVGADAVAGHPLR
ncbi:hypothetical protein [Mycobacteroides franklinii]|uniref:hypothetical protein n=1 Tax=Mycobacteroides franklinii TaxID=948102 RepID=UPI0019D5D559